MPHIDAATIKIEVDTVLRDRAIKAEEENADLKVLLALTRDERNTLRKGLDERITVLADLVRENERLRGDCKWTENNDGFWDGACGIAWTFEYGGSPTSEHGMVYCPKCGGRLKEVEGKPERAGGEG